MKILITDGENRSSLAVTRSLGRSGHTVVVTGVQKRNLSSASRFCNACYRSSDPVAHPEQFFDDIERTIKKENIEIIIPMTEPAMYILAEHKRSLSQNVLLAAPEWDTLQLVLDKAETLRIAHENDVDVPEGKIIRNRDDFYSKKNEFINFPVVIKPARSRIPVKDGFLKARVLYAKDTEELKRLYNETKFLDYPSIIQEKIIGPGIGLFTIFDGRQHLALFSHMRLKEKPPSGGVSVESMSIALNDRTVGASERLLKALNWKGVAMVEFKQDMRDGSYRLMEINGRFWGSLQLAISCGVNFPSLLVDYLTGGLKSSIPAAYLIGHRMKWPLGMLDHLLLSFKQKPVRLGGDFREKSRLKLFLEFMHFFESDCSYDVLDFRDISPATLELKQYIGELITARHS